MLVPHPQNTLREHDFPVFKNVIPAAEGAFFLSHTQHSLLNCDAFVLIIQLIHVWSTYTAPCVHPRITIILRDKILKSSFE